MTDKSKNEAQPIIDAIVLGDSKMLVRLLRRLADQPEVFIRVTGQLIDPAQPEYVSLVGVSTGYISDFYHADGKVFGAVYTDNGHILARKAGPCGLGLEHEVVKKIALECRAEYDETVIKKAVQLKANLEELDRLLTGHSFADSKLIGMAHGDLFKGHALLLAALNPAARQ